MKINIVRSQNSWVMKSITEQYQKHLPNCVITDDRTKVIEDGINLYMTWHSFKHKSKGIDIAWFTHKQDNRFDITANKVDYCIAMSNKTAALLPPEKTFVVEPGIDSVYIKEKIVIGCVGRHYPSNRKNYHLIEKLNKIPGIQILFTNGKLNIEDMPKFYKQIDYLLVLSDNEGGPMPVKEAIASGCPVIAPDVGWCWEYPIIRYDGFEKLEKILMRLSTPYTWEQSSKDLLHILSKKAKK